MLQRDDSGAVRFRHADGSAYGGVPNAQLLKTISKVFSALRNLGFRESDVKRTLGELRDREELWSVGAEEWLRAGVERLTAS